MGSNVTLRVVILRSLRKNNVPDSVGAGLFGSPAGRELTGAGGAAAASTSSSATGCGGGAGWRRRRKKSAAVAGSGGKFASSMAPLGTNNNTSSSSSSSSPSASNRVRLGPAGGCGGSCQHAAAAGDGGGEGGAERTGVDGNGSHGLLLTKSSIFNGGAAGDDGSPTSGCERTSGLETLSVASRVFRCVLAAGVRAGGGIVGDGAAGGRLQARRSSDEIFEEAAALWGLGCQMSDNCRCMDCQSRYFDCDFDCGSEEELASSPPPSPPPTPPPYQWPSDAAADASTSAALAGGFYSSIEHHQQQLANNRHASCCLL
ncbi:WAG22 antigen-like [Hetaerina americana]|uniref:WAG22 antigen-like n=1 Tax=Hetaerina americana TaxID=62018 RepID=UPI003A7F2C38